MSAATKAKHSDRQRLPATEARHSDRQSLSTTTKLKHQPLPSTTIYLMTLTASPDAAQMTDPIGLSDLPASTSASPNSTLLDVRDLRTHFATDRGELRAVDGVSFSLDHGRTIGIVGESGSGKSVTVRSIMNILPRNVGLQAGEVSFEGEDIQNLTGPEAKHFWGVKMSMIFQDPMTSLNPVVKVGRQITESLRYHLRMSRPEATARALELLDLVGIPEARRRLSEYPHQLSGGMCQRITIAIALACHPKLLIADEPTTALDVTVQKQILDLLDRLQTDQQMAMILITHDLGVVAGRADEIAVMYAGRIVEKAATTDLFASMRHPYTQALFESIPKIEHRSHTRLRAISGQPPDMTDLPAGCSFSPRCRYAQERCLTEKPPLETDPVNTNRSYACFYPVNTPAGEEALAINIKSGKSAAGLDMSREGLEGDDS